MKYSKTIHFPKSFIDEVIQKSIELNKNCWANYYTNIRIAFKKELVRILEDLGITVLSMPVGQNRKLLDCKKVELEPLTPHKEKLDIEFCVRYQHGDYSLDTVNYYQSYIDKFPSLLPFYQLKNYSIGNFCFYMNSGDYEINIPASQIVKMIGFSTNISPLLKRSTLCLWGVYFDYDIISEVAGKYIQNCPCENLEEYFHSYYGFPVIYICKQCGQVYICNCFEGYFTDDDFRNSRFSYDKNFLGHLKNFKYKNSICHLCTKGVPNYNYASTMYVSYFLARYYPYYHLLLKKYNLNLYSEKTNKEVEKELRNFFGFPPIGTNGVSEKILYKSISYLFTNYKAMNKYRGPELEGLEIDIFIPELKLAIEYQGQQHYKAMPHLGGEAGLEKRVANDERKKRLCKALNYSLIEIDYNDDITVPHLAEIFKKYLI